MSGFYLLQLTLGQQGAWWRDFCVPSGALHARALC